MLSKIKLFWKIFCGFFLEDKFKCYSNSFMVMVLNIGYKSLVIKK